MFGQFIPTVSTEATDTVHHLLQDGTLPEVVLGLGWNNKVSIDSGEEFLFYLTLGVEQLDMAGHCFRTAGAIPTLGTAEIGEVVAGHRHVLVTLTAKVPCKMEQIGLLEEQD